MLQRILTWMLVVWLSASLQAADTKSAVLPSPGGVWINGMEAADTVGGFSRATYWKPSPASRPASARTAPRFSFQPESVVRFADNLLVLDHGNLLVGTTTGMRGVRPLHHRDSGIRHGMDAIRSDRRERKHCGRGSQERCTHRAGRKSGEDSQRNAGDWGDYGASRGTGQPARIGSLRRTAQPRERVEATNTKLVVAGAVRTGILICLLAHCFGGGSRPVSPSQPLNLTILLCFISCRWASLGNRAKENPCLRKSIS